MALHPYRCGTGRDVYYAPPAEASPREDGAAPRLHTPLHFGGPRPAGLGFRVVADLGNGGTALVCLGATRAEAVSLARSRARGLAGRAAGFRLQHWVGGVRAGLWQDLSCRRGELPRPPRRRDPRSRGPFATDAPG
jgi:hypothetical protein